MKAYVYLHAASMDSDSLNEKIVELGYSARSCIIGDTFVDMSWKWTSMIL